MDVRFLARPIAEYNPHSPIHKQQSIQATTE